MGYTPSGHVTISVHVLKDFSGILTPIGSVQVYTPMRCPFISGVKLYTSTVLGERKDPHSRDVLRERGVPLYTSHAVDTHIH